MQIISASSGNATSAELFAQVMSGKFLPDTSHEWSILVLTPQSLSIDIPDSCKHAKIGIYARKYIRKDYQVQSHQLWQQTEGELLKKVF